MQEDFMNMAYLEAKKAFKAGEVPVGAVIVLDGQVISYAHNKREGRQNALCHAEILAIDKACKVLGTTHLDKCEMYVTLEPCPMCSGAIVSARLKKIHFACPDENYGCCGSVYNFMNDKHFECNVEVEQGEMYEKCKALIQNFFLRVRQKNEVKKLLGKKVHLDAPLEKTPDGFWKGISNGLPVYALEKDADEVACIVERINSFATYLVLSSQRASCIDIAKRLKLHYKAKLRTKEEIKIFDKNAFKN